MLCKPTYILFGFLCLLSSCKDDADPLIDSKQVAKLEITRIGTQVIPTQVDTYLFEYDQQGRLIKVNDKVFHYGSDGKVQFTRIHRKSPLVAGGPDAHEHIERIEYQWDPSGRLLSINLDSLYSKTTYGYETIGPNPSESLIRHIPLAAFTYDGNHFLPSKIVYTHTEALARVPSSGLEAKFEYEGNNISKHISPLLHTGLIGAPFPQNPVIGNIFVYYRYTDTPNPIYAVFKQLGFNPIDYSEIISEKLPDSRYIAAQPDGDASAVPVPDWSKAEKYQVSFDADGWPVEIRVNRQNNNFGMSNLGTVTKITYR